MKYTAIALFLSLIISSCHSPAKPAEDSKAPLADSSSNKYFFAVSDYIGGQVTLIIDSFKYPLTKTITVKGKSNLSSATDNELRALADQFRNPNINDSSIHKFYKETSIADQSNALVTFEYAATNASLPVQKIDVYIKPDPVAADKVTSVYIEKVFTKGDTTFSQKLYWKTAKNAQVITEKQVAGKSLPVEQVKIAWDPSE